MIGRNTAFGNFGRSPRYGYGYRRRYRPGFGFYGYGLPFLTGVVVGSALTPNYPYPYYPIYYY